MLRYTALSCCIDTASTGTRSGGWRMRPIFKFPGVLLKIGVRIALHSAHNIAWYIRIHVYVMIYHVAVPINVVHYDTWNEVRYA